MYPTGERILQHLLELYAEQENLKIEYSIEGIRDEGNQTQKITQLHTVDYHISDVCNVNRSVCDVRIWKTIMGAGGVVFHRCIMELGFCNSK